MKRHCIQLTRCLSAIARLAVIFPLLIATLGHPAFSQTGRTIKVVVPFPAGGSASIVARLLAEQISKSQGPTMIIENSPGAGASIGYELASRAAPDGNTLLIAANSIVINPLLRKTNYDPLTSFEAICYTESH
jgi:tripartite-type tricarboxylate transporter receptor subunit TctC